MESVIDRIRRRAIANGTHNLTWTPSSLGAVATIAAEHCVRLARDNERNSSTKTGSGVGSHVVVLVSGNGGTAAAETAVCGPMVL